MPHKSFTFTRAPAKPDPITFDITVEDQDGDVVRTEEFRCVDYDPIAAFATLNVSLNSGKIRGNAAANEFILTMLVPDDERRWLALVNDKTLRVDASELSAVIRWLVEVVSELPSGGPSASPDGPSTNGASSTAGAPSGESTP